MSATVVYVDYKHASTSGYGVVKVTTGNGLYLVNDALYMYKASTSLYGTVKVDPDGDLVIRTNGIGANVATTSNRGTVKPDGITIKVDADGTIHGAYSYVLPVATTSELGGVKPDGVTITVDQDGTIRGAQTYELPKATTEDLGGVIPDGDTVFVDDGVISVTDWSGTIERLTSMVYDLKRRVSILEGNSPSEVSYEGGDLITGWTYDNNTMITDADYTDGSIQ